MIKREKGIEYEVIKAKKESNINLVFVHGTGCNKKFLKSLALMFNEYNCYLIDLPGHGNSESTGYNFDNYVKAISSLVKKLDNVVLIGHSLGGTLVLKTASLNLKSILGIVPLNSSASWYDLDKEFMKKVHNGIIDLEYLMEASGDTDNEDVINALKTMEPNGVTIVDSLIDEYINIESCLDKIKVPTMIIGGEDEILAIPEYSKRLNESIKNSEMVMIPGRHMSCLAKKGNVKEIVCKFIDEKVTKKKVLQLV